MTQRPLAWVPLMVAVVMGAAVTGVVVWQMNVQSFEHRIEEKHASLKRLALSGGITPNQEVMDYLTARQGMIDARYHRWLQALAAPAIAEAAGADPQLYFQEQFHEVQRTLERLAIARTMAVPEQLGFPKELPPSDTVPRLLVQLELIKETAALIFEQGVTALKSLKIEDPEPVPEDEGGGPFLIRLPVRVRLTSSLPQLMKILGAIERANPIMDVRALRILPSSDILEVELVLARYLVNQTEHDARPREDVKHSPQSGATAPSRASHKTGQASPE